MIIEIPLKNPWYIVEISPRNHPIISEKIVEVLWKYRRSGVQLSFDNPRSLGIDSWSIISTPLKYRVKVAGASTKIDEVSLMYRYF